MEVLFTFSSWSILWHWWYFCLQFQPFSVIVSMKCCPWWNFLIVYILVRIHNFSDSFLANLALTAGILIHIVGWLVVYGLVMKYFDFTVFLIKNYPFTLVFWFHILFFFRLLTKNMGKWVELPRSSWQLYTQTLDFSGV